MTLQKADLASASMVFLTIWSKLSSSRSRYSSSAKTEDFRPSRKYLSIIGLVGAPTGSYSNKMDCRCSRWATQSSTDSAWYWESYLNLLQMLLAKAWLFPRFFLRKSLNSAHIIGAPSERCLYWCQCCTTDLWRNKAANRMRLGPLAPVVSKWFSHSWQKR